MCVERKVFSTSFVFCTITLHLQSEPGLALSAASLLISLLGERGNAATHDDIFLRSQDADITRALVGKVIEHCANDDLAHRPLLLALLDILDLTMAWNSSFKSLVDLVDARTAEVLIHVMAPKEIRIDQAGAFLKSSQNTSLMDGVECDTPPANNLSRLDEHSICIEQEEEQQATTGIDHSIRLASATTLARFAYADLDQLDLWTSIGHEREKGMRLIQSRIRSAVTQFFSSSTRYDDAALGVSTNVMFSTGLIKRRFRLLVSMAVPENESFLSGQMYAQEKHSENLATRLQKNIEILQKKIETAAQNEAKMGKENEEFKKKIDAQSVRFWHEVQRMKKTNAEHTRSTVAQFDAERKIAERRVVELSNKLKDAEARVSEADQAAKTSHEAETRLRIEVENLAKKTQALEEANLELKRQFEQRDSDLSEWKEKAVSTCLSVIPQQSLCSSRCDSSTIACRFIDRRLSLTKTRN